jgi:hypothetical protein
MSPNAGGGGDCEVSANEYSCAQGAQINFGDLTPYLTCGSLLLLYTDQHNLRIATVAFLKNVDTGLIPD